MNFYKDYNVLINRLDKAENKEKQAIKNKQSIYFERLISILKIRYLEYEERHLCPKCEEKGR